MQQKIKSNKENYGLLLEKELAAIEKDGRKPKLLMQSCCAPCSSYVLEYIAKYFDLTLFFYNPNIFPETEFTVRLNELSRFIDEAGYREIKIDAPHYDSTEFFSAVRGMEEVPEGGERCRVCYELRLRRTAERASAEGYDYFCTTLSISPHKNAAWLNEIGNSLEKEYNVRWLPSDFKKKNGYKRSIELSREYRLYRQDYCGCIYSKLEAERRNNFSNESSDTVTQ